MPTNPSKPAKWPRYAKGALTQTLGKLEGVSARVAELDANAAAIEAKAKEIEYAAKRGESIKVLALLAELRNLNADFRTGLLEIERSAIDARQILKDAESGEYGSGQ